MYATVDDIRKSTKGLAGGADSGVEDSVIQSFIDEGCAIINQMLTRRYVVAMMRTHANQFGWELLKIALGHYVRMRLENYLKLQQPAGEDDLEVVDGDREKKLFDELMGKVNKGEIVLMGYERSGTEVQWKMGVDPFKDKGDPPWW